MSTKDEQFWQALLAQSAPAFAGETEPPYGFTTRILAAARDEKRQEKAMERVGLRALFASLAVVTLTAVVTIGWQMQDSRDLDPGVKSLALVENFQVS